MFDGSYNFFVKIECQCSRIISIYINKLKNEKLLFAIMDHLTTLLLLS